MDTRSFSRLFILRFFHRNLVRFVSIIFIYPCFFSSHLTWRLFFNRTGTFKQLLVKLESIHAHRKLEQFFFFFLLASVWQKAIHFLTKDGLSFSQTKVTSPKSMSETNIINKKKSWSKSAALLPVQRINCNLVWVKNRLKSYKFVLMLKSHMPWKTPISSTIVCSVSICCSNLKNSSEIFFAMYYCVHCVYGAAFLHHKVYGL